MVIPALLPFPCRSGIPAAINRAHPEAAAISYSFSRAVSRYAAAFASYPSTTPR